jgi:hypothetical protein
MLLSDTSKIYGIPEGVYSGHNDRVDELNTRTQSRQFPDRPLTPEFDPRPVSTKYAHFPMVDRRRIPTNPDGSLVAIPQKEIAAAAAAAAATAPTNQRAIYSISTNFSPATRNAPVSGYFSNVDSESQLRNLGIALQRGAEQGVYVPSSQSDLYRVQVPFVPSTQPHPELFSQDTYANSRRAPPNVGRELFMNNTRTQLRNL